MANDQIAEIQSQYDLGVQKVKDYETAIKNSQSEIAAGKNVQEARHALGLFQRDLQSWKAHTAAQEALLRANQVPTAGGQAGYQKPVLTDAAVAQKQQNVLGTIEANKLYAQQQIKEGDLGRLDEGAISTGRSLEMQDIIARRKAALAGMSEQELQMQRDVQGQAINRATEASRRQLASAQAGAGVRGGTASAQQLQVLMSGMQAKAGLERDLQLQNSELRRSALNNYEASVTSAESSEYQKQLARLELQKFNLSQKAREQGAQLNLAMGLTGLALSDVASDKAISAQQQAAAQTSSGGKIICTELYEQGIMPEDIYIKDQDFGRFLEKTHPEILDGYQCWATTIVKGMKRSKRFTKVVAAIAMPWAHYMAGSNNILGLFLMSAGLPICGLIGHARKLLRIK